MSVELRSAKKTIYLVGAANHQITGAKLPSNGQILAVLFFNIRDVKLTVSESANLVYSRVHSFLGKGDNTHEILSKLCKETCGSSSCLAGASKQ